MTKTKQDTSPYAADYAYRLREILPQGSTVRTVLRHVTRSGMSRNISVLAIVDGDIQDISFMVAPVLGLRRGRNGEGVKVDGGGMDMGSHLVYTLAQALYDDGYALNNRWL